MFHFQQRDQNNEMILAVCRGVFPRCVTHKQSYNRLLYLRLHKNMSDWTSFLNTLFPFFLIRVSRLKFAEQFEGNIKNKPEAEILKRTYC